MTTHRPSQTTTARDTGIPTPATHLAATNGGRMVTRPHRATAPGAPFGALLRQHLATRGLSQARFARAAGTDRSSVSRLIAGVRAPSRTMALTLARHLELDAAETARLLHVAGFTAGDESAAATPLPPEVAALHDAITRCPRPAARASALRLVTEITGLLEACHDDQR